MRSVSVRLDDLRTMSLNIGFVGENEHRRFIIDCKKMYDEYPHAAVSMTIQPPEGEAYPAIVERDGDFVIWDVTDSDLTYEGDGELQLAFTAEPHVAKSYIARTKISRSIVPTGEVPSGIDDFLTRAGAALTAIPETIEDALAAAKASGEFDGADGQDGQDGADGFSPTVAVTEITGGHQVAVTDAGGTTTFDVMDGVNGQDGSDGAPGADGFSPRATVSKSGKVATITITDAAGTTTATVSDGEDGQGTNIIDDTAGAGDTDKTFSADKLTAMDSELKNAITSLDNSKAPVIIDSASGAIATFPDGADGLPVESLIAEINPVQDLHEQSAPYPPGGGKNKFYIPSATVVGSGVTYAYDSTTNTLTKSGTSSGTAGYNLGTFSVPAGEYTLSAKFASTGSSTSVYLRNKSTDTNVGYIDSASPSVTRTLDAGEYYFRVATQSGETGGTISEFQLESGSSKTSYSPYSNICPITGWTGCNVTRCGRNLLPKPVDGTYTGNGVTAVVKDGVITLSGTTTASGNAFTIPLTSVATVPPGAYIHLLNSVANASVAPSFELSTDVSGTSVAPACSPANRIYQTNKTNTVTWDRIRFYLVNGVAISGTLSPMLCLDDVVSDFVPFARYDTYHVTWQTAGTVYGGTVNSVTGKLIVTDAEIESYNGETLPSTWISDRDVYAEGTTPTIGAQVVYKLAEPLVYDLDSITVNTLLAYNAIFADTGDVSVDYRADTKLWIDGHSGSSITVDSALSSTSENPVQNKVINTALAAKEPKHNTTTVSGTTPSITGVANTRYICGEVATLTIVVPASGCIDVTFTSGSTPTVLTVTPTKTGVTAIEWADGFNTNAIAANATYWLKIIDGEYGVATAWGVQSSGGGEKQWNHTQFTVTEESERTTYFLIPNYQTVSQILIRGSMPTETYSSDSFCVFVNNKFIGGPDGTPSDTAKYVSLYLERIVDMWIGRGKYTQWGTNESGLLGALKDNARVGTDYSDGTGDITIGSRWKNKLFLEGTSLDVWWR